MKAITGLEMVGCRDWIKNPATKQRAYVVRQVNGGVLARSLKPRFSEFTISELELQEKWRLA